jgi:Ca-activated chloride channel family protein
MRVFAIAAAAALAAGASLPAAPQGRFAVSVDVVRVDALVTADGHPVHGLTATDFEVRDNGVVQQVDLVDTEQLPVNAILALDMSGSVAGDRLAHLRNAGHALVDALRKDDRAALVSFSHVVALGSGLTSDFNRVRQALDRAQPNGNTSLVDASYAGLILGESNAGRALMIAFSDGLDTASWLTPDRVLDTGKRSDVVVYGVSLAGEGKATFLRDLGAVTGGSLIEIASTKDLDAEFLRVLDEFRQRYLLSYSPRGVTKEGYHRLEVRVKERDVRVKARPGYLAGG